MATIKSNAIGAGRGSLDLLTYRTVRGRTIACRRVTENKSNTKKQSEQRSAFSEVCSLAKLLVPVIEIGFDKTEKGSRRNNFTQSNNEYMSYLKSRNIFAVVPPMTTLCRSLKDPLFAGKVMAAKGTYRAKSTFGWDDELQPYGEISLSRFFEAKDLISVAVCISYCMNGEYYDMVTIYQTVLGQLAVSNLANPRKFVVNKDSLPEFVTLLDDIEEGATEIEIAITAIVEGEKGRSDSYFTLMPARPYAFRTSGQTTIENNTVMQILAPDARGFAHALHDDALGASLLIDDKEYIVKGFSDGADEMPNGLLFDAPNGMNYREPFEGDPIGEPVPLVKNGVVLAYIDGLFTPMLAI